MLIASPVLVSDTNLPITFTGSAPLSCIKSTLLPSPEAAWDAETEIIGTILVKFNPIELCHIKHHPVVIFCVCMHPSDTELTDAVGSMQNPINAST